MGDAGHGEPVDVADLRIEIDSVCGLGKVLSDELDDPNVVPKGDVA